MTWMIFRKVQLPAMPGPGASRLIVADDGFGNQALKLVPADRAVFVMYLPAAKPAADRRRIKDRFARIGQGLTAVDGRVGEGEWHPPFRPKVVQPTERVEGVGPHTPEAVAEFLEVLSAARCLLGQVCVLGMIIPDGLIIEVWG